MQVHPQLQQLRDELRARFPERQDVIDGALATILCGEHVLLVGPPGTAKSGLIRAIARAFGAVLFERLLTRTSIPEELLGPMSLHALDKGHFTHVTTGMIPEAHFVLMDQIFAAGSPVINLLIRLLDERVFLNDGAPVPVPLVSLFGATSELPENGTQEHLFDRFLLRFELDYLQRPSSLRTVLAAPEPTAATMLGMEALSAMQEAIPNVKLTEETLDAAVVLRDAMKEEGLVASDRRWKKSLRLVQAAAFLAGEAQTCPEDLTTLVDVLWHHPRERERVARIVGRLVNPVAFQAGEILEDGREAAAKAHALKPQHRRAYLAQAARALLILRAQVEMLVRLSGSASRRARAIIDDAVAELNELHAELARDVHANQGLKVLK
ncbi:AAA family ATPase [Myxococcus sp. Y35]|uniref:AAA family ATPase n=1 Tax=Pseudomyxococcus flavus TaxID=3115648 RepID=UPI003CFABDE4